MGAMTDDPTRPGFWDERYTAGRTPWDQGGVPPELARRLAARKDRGLRVLIPGCGQGHEVSAFAAAGHDVTAIDFSAPAVERARTRLGPALAPRVQVADFFHHAFIPGTFDLVYERTFLCAQEPASWPRVARRTAELLRPGGALLGFYFLGPKEDGPPYGLDPEEPAAIFGADFTLVESAPVPATESLPLFAGREFWHEWRRRA
jgi:SAM-dependent methyltransferase